MSSYIDKKYLLFLSPRLERFTEKKNSLFNFRCPICGDSKKSKIKCRAYVYERSNKFFFSCHNCGLSLNFSSFLQQVDPLMHKEYYMEQYKEKFNRVPRKKKDEPVVIPKGPKVRDFHDNLINIHLLPDGHVAKEYIKNRKLPKERWKDIHFTDDFKKLLDESFPEHGKDLIDDDPRIVLFFKNAEKRITHVLGRSVNPNTMKLRYVIVKVDPNTDRKVFGLDSVDYSQHIYLTEGAFDSMFVKNSIASGDSALLSVAETLFKTEKEKVTLVYDNESRNKEICKVLEMAITAGYSVVIFPPAFTRKDINDMVLSGEFGSNSVTDVLKENTCRGLDAKLRFTSWKKC